MSKNNINHIDLVDKVEGYDRRLEFMKMPLENNSFLPKTVNYKDIDLSFKEWVDQIKRTELARAAYRKDKTIENADKLLACVEGGKYYG